MLINGAMIDVRKIRQHPLNPRKDLGDLTELIDSIRKQGILQNLTVVSDPEAAQEFDRYIAVIGHRRLAAAKSAGLSEVPCNIVEMNMQEQLVTMMSENMQRADLTPYEQAHGFQTMLDFGEDLESITVKTGFSESTVRRRLKLLELDQPQLKAAVDKGVSLIDLMKLEKIEDITERNTVLAQIGTHNFDYYYRNAISNQKDKKEWQETIEQIATWARPAESDDEWKVAKICISIYKYGRKDTEPPEDSGDYEYIYRLDSNGNSVYIGRIGEANEEDNEQKQQEEAEMRREQQRQQYQSLQLEWAKCKDLRGEYVLAISEKRAKDLSRAVMKQMLISSLGYYSRTSVDDLAEFLETDGDSINAKIASDENIERFSLIYIYLLLEYPLQPYDWKGRFVPGGRLIDLKSYMDSIGYEMSDVEISLFDGSHELYTKAEEGK